MSKFLAALFLLAGMIGVAACGVGQKSPSSSISGEEIERWAATSGYDMEFVYRPPSEDCFVLKLDLERTENGRRGWLPRLSGELEFGYDDPGRGFWFASYRSGAEVFATRGGGDEIIVYIKCD